MCIISGRQASQPVVASTGTGERRHPKPAPTQRERERERESARENEQREGADTEREQTERESRHTERERADTARGSRHRERAVSIALRRWIGGRPPPVPCNQPSLPTPRSVGVWRGGGDIVLEIISRGYVRRMPL